MLAPRPAVTTQQQPKKSEDEEALKCDDKECDEAAKKRKDALDRLDQEISKKIGLSGKEEAPEIEFSDGETTK